MFEYLMLGDFRARKYSKTGARTCSRLEKFAFDTTLQMSRSTFFFKGKGVQNVQKYAHVVYGCPQWERNSFPNFSSVALLLSDHQSVTEKLGRVTPTVEVKTYSSLGIGKLNTNWSAMLWYMQNVLMLIRNIMWYICDFQDWNYIFCSVVFWIQ